MPAMPAEPAETQHARAHLPAVGVIAVGGGVGSVLRYGLGRALPAAPGAFPVATLVTNLIGSLLLGALIVAVTEVWRPHRLVRHALGTGVLGGLTTFSTFVIETRTLANAGALAYVGATVVGSIVMAGVGMSAVRRFKPRLHPALIHEAVDPYDPDLP